MTCMSPTCPPRMRVADGRDGARLSNLREQEAQHDVRVLRPRDAPLLTRNQLFLHRIRGYRGESCPVYRALVLMKSRIIAQRGCGERLGAE